jgi:hypothetical protein
MALFATLIDDFLVPATDLDATRWPINNVYAGGGNVSGGIVTVHLADFQSDAIYSIQGSSLTVKFTQLAPSATTLFAILDSVVSTDQLAWQCQTVGGNTVVTPFAQDDNVFGDFLYGTDTIIGTGTVVRDVYLRMRNNGSASYLDISLDTQAAWTNVLTVGSTNMSLDNQYVEFFGSSGFYKVDWVNLIPRARSFAQIIG